MGLTPLTATVSISDFNDFFVRGIILCCLTGPFSGVRAFGPLGTLILFTIAFVVDSTISCLFCGVPGFGHLVVTTGWSLGIWVGWSGRWPRDLGDFKIYTLHRGSTGRSIFGPVRGKKVFFFMKVGSFHI